jgi:hypothetical protein
MKKIIVACMLLVSASAFAWGHYGYRGYYHGYGYGGWVAPALIGGAIGYGIASTPVYANPPVVYTQPPVVYTQPSVTAVQPNCSAWTEVRNPDGSVTTQRTCQ